MAALRSRTPSRTPARANRAAAQRGLDGTADPVEVFCRLRTLPSGEDEAESCARADDDYTVTIFPPESWQPSRQLNQPKESTNTFTRVFADWCQQADVFDRVAVNLVEDLLRGKNGLLFTYGITGSGKTFTMTGNPREPGILPRCLDVVFNSIDGLQAEPDTFTPDGQNGYDICGENDDGGLVSRQRAKLESKATKAFATAGVPVTPGRRPLASVNADDEWEMRPRQAENTKVTDSETDHEDQKRPTAAELAGRFYKITAIDEDCVYEVRVSFVEIYNNYIYDLLDPNATNGSISSSSMPNTDHSSTEVLSSSTTTTNDELSESGYRSLMMLPPHRRRVTLAARKIEKSKDQVRRKANKAVSVRGRTTNKVKDPLFGRLPSKSLREDMNHNMYVSGATEYVVANTDEAFQLLKQGQAMRRVAQTQLNMESSRSHSVFSMRLVQAPLDETGRRVVNDKSLVRVSQLCLVDLAGSERSNRTKHQGERMKETGHINQSLMCLRQCIDVLRENQSSNGDRIVPYRDSRLTHMFKNYFDGQGKVRMIVCINPMAGDYEENLHVMQFAEATQEVVVQRAAEAPNYADLQGLAAGRRRNAILEEQVAAEMAMIIEDSPVKRVTNHGKAASTSFFEAMPNITMHGPSDDEMLARIRRHFETKMKARDELLQRYQENEIIFEADMRAFMIKASVSYRISAEAEAEREKLQTELARVMSENKQMKHKNQTLIGRLSKYECDAQSRYDRDEAQRRKERELEAAAIASANKLKAVREVFERGSPIVNAGMTPSARFGGSTDTLTKTRTPAPAATPGVRATPSARMYPRITTNKTPGTSTQQTPGGQPVFNRRYHRRSKSTGMVIDHQPTNRVPGGEVMTPRIGARKITTNRPSADNLRAGSEYVLTHQEQDQRTGALRTSLVKFLRTVQALHLYPVIADRNGEIIPTAGGGSAVCFNDVEVLSHHTPGQKRASDGSSSEEHHKRTRR